MWRPLNLKSDQSPEFQHLIVNHLGTSLYIRTISLQSGATLFLLSYRYMVPAESYDGTLEQQPGVASYRYIFCMVLVLEQYILHDF